MIGAVIFDLNGVFIQSPLLSDRFRDEFNVPTDKFLPVLQDVMAKVRKPGAGDAFLYWQSHLTAWGVNLTKEQFFDFWFSAEKEVPEMVKVAKQLKDKGIKLFILSNNFAERSAYYDQNFPFLKDFDKIYYSWQTGFVKPDLEAYRNLLEENNLAPDKCLYFDDSAKNIEAAAEVGIVAHPFKDIRNVGEVLSRI